MKNMTLKKFLLFQFVVILALTAVVIIGSEKVEATSYYPKYTPYTAPVVKPTAPSALTQKPSTSSGGIKILSLTGSTPQYITMDQLKQRQQQQLQQQQQQLLQQMQQYNPWGLQQNSNSALSLYQWMLNSQKSGQQSSTTPTLVPNTNVMVISPKTITGVPEQKKYGFPVIYDQQGNPYFSPYNIPSQVVQSYLQVAPNTQKPTTPAQPQTGYMMPNPYFGYPMLPFVYPGMKTQQTQPQTTTQQSYTPQMPMYGYGYYPFAMPYVYPGYGYPTQP